MSKSFPFFALLGAAISIFQYVKSNAPPIILKDSRIQLLKGYDVYNCYYGKFYDAYDSICLSGVNTEYKSIESVKKFYATQMENIGWVKIPNSLHENPITEKNTDFFVKKASSNCQMERAITVNQNIYRGDIKLEDISIEFTEYLVECKTINITTNFLDYEQ